MATNSVPQLSRTFCPSSLPTHHYSLLCFYQIPLFQLWKLLRALQWNHVATTIATAATGMMPWPCLGLSGICAMIFNMNEVSATFFSAATAFPISVSFCCCGSQSHCCFCYQAIAITPPTYTSTTLDATSFLTANSVYWIRFKLIETQMKGKPYWG